MPMRSKSTPEYQGVEQGPIRPPSEALSLLIRITRNCPWNRCSFCPVYKGAHFSLRPVSHVLEDIDRIHRCVKEFREPVAGRKGGAEGQGKDGHGPDVHPMDPVARQAALHWAKCGMQSIFLQDANSLIIKPAHLIEILNHLKHRFPWVKRITSYARSHTIARIKDADLQAMRKAGLNRIHIGLESGSDTVLKKVSKGVDQETHVNAGLKVKKAGMELSEYVMPGLGGKALSHEHAIETAKTVNRINPDFIRLRSLAIPDRCELYRELQTGSFEKCTDLQTAREIRTFLGALENITSMMKSDHILNLFQEIEGRLPEDKAAMLDILDAFLAMSPEHQCIYQMGRRLGIMSRLSDMERPNRVRKVAAICQELGVTPETVDRYIDEMMTRFV